MEQPNTYQNYTISPFRHSIHDMPEDDRPRERLARFGAPTLQTAELLAVILRVGVKNCNAVELAQQLLQVYGGLTGLLRADFAELCSYHGMAEAKTAQIKAALEIGRRLAVTMPGDRPQIKSPEDVMRLIGIEMAALPQEQLRVLLLDTKNMVAHIQTIYQGTVNASLVRVSEALRPAVTRNCPSIIITHNHPSGDPTPSQEDKRITEQIYHAAKLLDIALLDHIIIGQGRCLSMREAGMGFPNESGSENRR